ncbi:hypothetical protein E4U47_000292 [Claviceps purpurea]|nr:hypothetical protein E4U47_000292 [Claviceps purpurea]
MTCTRPQLFFAHPYSPTSLISPRALSHRETLPSSRRKAIAGSCFGTYYRLSSHSFGFSPGTVHEASIYVSPRTASSFSILPGPESVRGMMDLHPGQNTRFDPRL